MATFFYANTNIEYILDFLEGLNKYIEHNSISVDTVRFDLQQPLLRLRMQLQLQIDVDVAGLSNMLCCYNVMLGLMIDY